MKKKIMIIIVLILVIGLLIFLAKKEKIDSDYDFKVYFFNAGKADAILLSKNHEYMMIDTGESSLSDEILKYFKDNNITKLKYLIITHFDKDHVGSASAIIDNIEIDEILQSNVPKDSEYYNNYVNSLNNKGVTPTIVSGNYLITLDDMEITVNGPKIVYDSNESNNSSLIVSIIDNNNRFLFMGDAQNARIKDFLEENNNTYDFLKVPYHGKYLKQLDNLLEEVEPKYGVITCSKKEGCEDKTLSVLNEYNVKYYQTKNGSITILSNGYDIVIKE